MKRILIVDDSPDIRKSIRQAINIKLPADATLILEAASIFQLQAYLDVSEQFDLIFLDGDLGNGETTLSLITPMRALFPNCMMVAMGSLLHEDQRKAGCNVTLTKPCTIADIHAILAQAFPAQ